MAKYYPDIYHGDNVKSWNELSKNIPFLIFKGTEGTSIVSSTLTEYINKCEEYGIPYWIYTFLRKGNELAQTKYLVKTCKKKVGPLFVGYVLDAELNNPVANVRSAMKWLTSETKSKGYKTMLYTQHSQYSDLREAITTRSEDCAWWESRYGKNDGTYRSKYHPHSGVDFHQFTDKGSCPGIGGDCDLSRLTGTKSEEWFKTRTNAVETVTVKESDIIICGHGSGRPTIKKLNEYNSARYAKKAPNGKHKGVIAVRRFKAMTDAQRVKFHDTYETILGRNIYSQNLRQYVYRPRNGRYYSDCSSSGMATYEKIGCKGFGWYYNTAAIYESDLFEDVPVKIKDGHILNPEVLKVGDPILYIGNNPDRPEQIGHVEWVYEVPALPAPKKTTATTTKTGYKGDWPVLDNGRGYFQEGDGITTLTNYPTQIKRIQMLVNWINSGERCETAVDGQYGEDTAKAVAYAQKILGVTDDGVFGKKTLDAAKKYKK